MLVDIKPLINYQDSPSLPQQTLTIIQERERSDWVHSPASTQNGKGGHGCIDLNVLSVWALQREGGAVASFKRKTESNEGEM